MADSPAKPKLKVETSKWATAKRPKLILSVEKRQALWSAINAFVRQPWWLDYEPCRTATIRIEVPNVFAACRRN